MEEKKKSVASEEAASEGAKKEKKTSETEEDKKENKKEDKADKKDEKEEAKAEKIEENEDDEDDEDDDDDAGDLILENIRESVPLTPKNAKFYRSQGNLISMTLTVEGKEPEIFERVVLVRAFPLTNPTEFISVREPYVKELGGGREIGMIRYSSDFDEATNNLFNEELDRRYFAPKILKINSCKDKFGYTYWDVDTSAGHITFVLNNPFSNIKVLEDNRVMINDIDGNAFEIPDPKQLDKNSYRKIEIYL